MRAWCLCVFVMACGGGAPSSDGGEALDAGASGADAGRADAGPREVRAVPRAVDVARATEIPTCTLHVDAASGGGDGTAASPFATIGAAVDAASDGAVICVAEGVYPETIAPADRGFTLAGGFRSGAGFTERDSSVYVSRAQGDGTGSFVRIEGDVAPGGGALTAIDGFEITGYERGVLRATYFSQRFELTNNHIHGNRCRGDRAFGGGFLLTNVSGRIAGNVIEDNTCGFGGGGAILEDASLPQAMTVEGNRVVGNVGADADCHGGGLYLLATDLTVRANDFVENRCVSWGGGLYVGALPPQRTVARLEWNVYRANRADNMGGGFFCDDGARCVADHEIYDGNCGGNVLLDGSYDPTAPTEASFDHVTNRGARAVGCGEPGAGVIVNKANDAPDAYTITSSVFFDNGDDLAAFCDSGCATLSIDVTYSALRLENPGDATVTFGVGNLDGVDPRFVEASSGDLHLRSTDGHWTPAGPVPDAEDSPALAAGDPAGSTSGQPERAGERTEMGAYGNSAEASFVR